MKKDEIRSPKSEVGKLLAPLAVAVVRCLSFARWRQAPLKLQQLVLERQDQLFPFMRVVLARALHLARRPVHSPPQRMDLAFQRLNLLAVPLVVVGQFPELRRQIQQLVPNNFSILASTRVRSTAVSALSLAIRAWVRLLRSSERSIFSIYSWMAAAIAAASRAGISIVIVFVAINSKASRCALSVARSGVISKPKPRVQAWRPPVSDFGLPTSAFGLRILHPRRTG